LTRTRKSIHSSKIKFLKSTTNPKLCIICRKAKWSHGWMITLRKKKKSLRQPRLPKKRRLLVKAKVRLPRLKGKIIM